MKNKIYQSKWQELNPHNFLTKETSYQLDDTCRLTGGEARTSGL